MDVWHWNDPLINSQQKKSWNHYKNRVYLSIYHFQDDWYVQLTDQQVPELWESENPAYALGFSALPYQKEITWDDNYKDVYLVNLNNGSRQKILSHHPVENRQQDVSLSPQGRFIVYYKDRNCTISGALPRET